MSTTHPAPPLDGTAQGSSHSAQFAYLCTPSAVVHSPRRTAVYGVPPEKSEAHLCIVETIHGTDDTPGERSSSLLPNDVLYILPNSTEAGAVREIEEIVERLKGADGVRLNKRWAPVDYSMRELWKMLHARRSDVSEPSARDTDEVGMEEAATDLVALSEASHSVRQSKKKKRACPKNPSLTRVAPAATDSGNNVARRNTRGRGPRVL